jgi:hypothetical protein
VSACRRIGVHLSLVSISPDPAAEAPTYPNKQRHKVPIDSPKDGIALVLVILNAFDMSSSSQIENIAMSLDIFVAQ